jgi:hypothetical protein
MYDTRIPDQFYIFNSWKSDFFPYETHVIKSPRFIMLNIHLKFDYLIDS